MKKFKLAISLLLILFFTSSCVETIIGASLGATYLSSREKNVKNTAIDVKISSQIAANFIVNGLKNPGNSVDVTVSEGRVLLTGIVRSTKKARLAIDIAWKAKGVKEVIDEIQISRDPKIRFNDLTSSFIDYSLTAKVEAKLLLTKDVLYRNYKITTIDKTIYLLGIAKNQQEIQKVLQSISMVMGVERVVNHVILKDDPRRRG